MASWDCKFLGIEFAPWDDMENVRFRIVAATPSDYLYDLTNNINNILTECCFSIPPIWESFFFLKTGYKGEEMQGRQLLSRRERTRRHGNFSESGNGEPHHRHEQPLLRGQVAAPRRTQSPRRHKRAIRLHLPGAPLRQDHGRQYDRGVLFKEL